MRSYLMARGCMKTGKLKSQVVFGFFLRGKRKSLKFLNRTSSDQKELQWQQDTLKLERENWKTTWELTSNSRERTGKCYLSTDKILEPEGKIWKHAWEQRKLLPTA